MRSWMNQNRLGLLFFLTIFLIGAAAGSTFDWVRIRPGTLPSTGANGELRIDSADGNLKKYSTANAAWELIAGGGGSGGINYLEDNTDIESSATGYVAYADAAAATPADGTGGSATSTCTRTTTAGQVLRGTGSLKIDKPASNEQGEGCSYDFSVDPQDELNGSKAVVISFDYMTTSGYVANDIVLFVYDKDGTTLLSVLNTENGGLLASTTPGRFIGVFFTTQNNDDYRLVWHIATSSATAYSVYIDNIRAGPETVHPTPYAVDLGTEAWADNQGNATTSVNLTRDGKWLFVEGLVTYTGAQSGAFTITIPAAYTPDTTIYSTGSSQRYLFGTDVILRDAGTSIDNGFAYFAGTNIEITLDSLNSISSTTPHTWASGDSISFKAKWIVNGWKETALTSTSERLLNLAKFSTYKTSNQAVASTSATKITWPTTPTTDNMSGFDSSNNRYVVKKAGRYNITGAATINAGSDEFWYLRIYKNGSAIATRYIGSNSPSIEVSASLELAVNDYIELYIQSSADTSYEVFADATIRYTKLDIEMSQPEKHFGTYGTFEILSTTSSVKTPSADGRYHAYSGNSLTLTPGTWRLTGVVLFGNSGSSPAYTTLGVGYYGANGGDSASIPALLTTLSGLTVLTQIGTDGTTGLDAYINSPASAGGTLAAPPVIVRVTKDVTVYLSSFCNLTTAANARLTAKFSAERLQ